MSAKSYVYSAVENRIRRDCNAKIEGLSNRITELSVLLDKTRGDLANALSAQDEARLNYNTIRNAQSECKMLFEHYQASGFRALVASFLKEIRDERRRLVMLLQNGEED